jgi:hypothetical protein
MGRKGTAKAIRRPRKAARDDDEEDGEVLVQLLPPYHR